MLTLTFHLKDIICCCDGEIRSSSRCWPLDSIVFQWYSIGANHSIRQMMEWWLLIFLRIVDIICCCDGDRYEIQLSVLTLGCTIMIILLSFSASIILLIYLTSYIFEVSGYYLLLRRWGMRSSSQCWLWAKVPSAGGRSQLDPQPAITSWSPQ